MKTLHWLNASVENVYCTVLSSKFIDKAKSDILDIIKKVKRGSLSSITNRYYPCQVSMYGNNISLVENKYFASE